MRVVIIFLFLVCAECVEAQKANPEHYAYPFEENYQPLLIRLNGIVLYRDDGTGNFDLQDPEEKELILEYLEQPNRIYSNFQKPEDLTDCYEGDDFIKDASIRFVPNLVPIKDTYYWDYLNSGSIPEEKKLTGFSPSQKWYIKPLDDSISNSDIPKGINAYFTNNGKRYDDLLKKKGEGNDLAGIMAAELPSSTDLKRSSQLHSPNRYIAYLFQRYQSPKNYKTTWEETKWWWLGSGFSHELGHNLGLNHSSEYYSANKCRYTLMSQKNDHNRNWLPPNEIKKIHWNLTRTNLMQFVTPESYYGSNAIWHLRENAVWDKPRRFYHNFELASNIILTISDSIILPPQGYIKMNKNSKIIFKENGKIVDAFGKEFTNFEMHRSADVIYNK